MWRPAARAAPPRGDCIPSPESGARTHRNPEYPNRADDSNASKRQLPPGPEAEWSGEAPARRITKLFTRSGESTVPSAGGASAGAHHVRPPEGPCADRRVDGRLFTVSDP